MSEHKGYLGKEWEQFVNSMQICKLDALKVALLEISWIATTIGCFYILGQFLLKLVPQIEGIKQSMYNVKSGDIFGIQGIYGDATGAYRLMVLYIIVFGLIAFALFSAIKCLVYCVVNHHKISWALLLKFLWVNALWSIIILFTTAVLQRLLYIIYRNSMMASAWSQISLIFLAAFLAFLLFYLTLSVFIPFTLKNSFKSGIKGLWRIGIKKLHRASFALIAAVVIMAMINIIMMVLAKLPRAVYLILTTLMVATYFVWLRFYFTSVVYHIAGREFSTVDRSEENCPKEKSHKIRHKVIHKIRHVIIRKKKK
ncbi:MAG: hypothetical protein ABIA62_08325 [Candidatus Woesearchaeota archaeon]